MASCTPDLDDGKKEKNSCRGLTSLLTPQDHPKVAFPGKEALARRHQNQGRQRRTKREMAGREGQEPGARSMGVGMTDPLWTSRAEFDVDFDGSRQFNALRGYVCFGGGSFR